MSFDDNYFRLQVIPVNNSILNKIKLIFSTKAFQNNSISNKLALNSIPDEKLWYLLWCTHVFHETLTVQNIRVFPTLWTALT